MAIDLKSLGRNIGLTRRRMRMTQFEFAEHVSVHPNYVSQLERGRKEPSLNLLNRIRETLDLSWAELFAAEEKPRNGRGKNGVAADADRRRLMTCVEKLDPRTLAALVNFVSAASRAKSAK
jgi:transcriptional regulator with XRE-family HTH domain